MVDRVINTATKGGVFLAALMAFSEVAIAYDSYRECYNTEKLELMDRWFNPMSDKDASVAAALVCEKYKKPSTVEIPSRKSLSALGADRPALNRLLINIGISQMYQTRDGRSPYTLDVTNSNQFPIWGLEIGYRANPNERCSYNRAAFRALYWCVSESGQPNGNSGSGRFFCDIPRGSESYPSVCVTGLGVYGTTSQVNSFMDAYKIRRLQ